MKTNNVKQASYIVDDKQRKWYWVYSSQKRQMISFYNFFPSHAKNSLNLFVTFFVPSRSKLWKIDLLFISSSSFLIYISFMMCDIIWIIFKLECRLAASPDFIFIVLFIWKFTISCLRQPKKNLTNEFSLLKNLI